MADATNSYNSNPLLTSTGESTSFPAPVHWTEHLTPDGKRYYFNTLTKQSVWDRPSELGPETNARYLNPWKEYVTPEGKKYYYNSITKITTWDKPADYEDTQPLLLETRTTQQTPLEDTPRPVSESASQPHEANSLTSIFPSEAPEFSTREEAESAFITMLRETGVESSWSWERTMRATINKPMYRALRSISERKKVFEHFIQMRREEEKTERRERRERRRKAFVELLETHPKIESYTRYRNAVKILGNEKAFREMENPREREEVYEEFVSNWRLREKEEQRKARKQNMEKFAQILNSLPSITLTTTWEDAQEMYKSHPEFQNDKSLQSMDRIDFLLVYEDHIRSLKRMESKRKQQEAFLRYRRERKNRDEFKKLLQSLIFSGAITESSRWMDVYPLVKGNEFYQSMLGQPGSSPIELFWDALMLNFVKPPT